jgi:bifunctional ADP-heptose synthase (sugar kinase/adenylyltransferase)
MFDTVLERAAKNDKLLIAVDPKPSRKLNINGAGLLTPNRAEALQLAGFNEVLPDDQFPLEEICRIIL